MCLQRFPCRDRAEVTLGGLLDDLLGSLFSVGSRERKRTSDLIPSRRSVVTRTVWRSSTDSVYVNAVETDARALCDFKLPRLEKTS